ncbi:HAD-IC family P-type ATPase [Candidatus Kaiserbacteria bacterium]|nr:HAD-IC family P-type ATPase [Candidatus Kaiserbacteria bacterium]
MKKPITAPMWHATSIVDTLKMFKVEHVHGLSTEDVENRLKLYGKNILQKRRSLGFLGVVIKQFRGPLIVILLLAGVATVFLHEYLDSLVIFIALLINVIIGSFQERRASQAFEKLNQSQEKHATVIRDGAKVIVLAEELVVGDIVILEGGMYIPADLRLIESSELSVNEAILTGEWISVSKEASQIHKEQAPLGERTNMAWMGTLVSSGYGQGVVVYTGKETQMGAIAKLLQSEVVRATPLQQSVHNIARLLVYIILGSATVIFLLGILHGESVSNMLLVVIAIAVASMPEGLPAAVTIVLAIGMEAILKEGGLVRNLLAAETLGSTTIVLTDKTGTLTEAKMKLFGLYTLEGVEDGVSDAEGDNEYLLSSAILTTDAFVEELEEEVDKEKQIVIHGRPIEKAIVSAGIHMGVMQGALLHELPRLDFLQFESRRRFAASLHSQAGSTKNLLYLSGAPEFLLEHATHVYHKGRSVVMSEDVRKRLSRKQNEMSNEGYRFIGLAYREVGLDSMPTNEEEKDRFIEKSTFIGLIAFSDPVRENVAESIATVKKAGVRVVMVTGDNPQTAKQIAILTGIAYPEDDVLTGNDIDHLSDEELFEEIKRVPVFARVLPEQKLHIVRVLKDHNEVVAMTGDGVNDAPALQSADIGVAVGSGTEVAKAASDIILINNSFTIITSAIKEGRRIIDNLKKIVAYLLSTSFSEIFVIGGALAFGAPLPLLPGQILWANIIEEGFMSFSFAFEKAEDGVMSRSPRENLSKRVLTKKIKQLIAIISIITGVFLTILYFILLAFDIPIEEVRTFMFVALSLDSIFFAFSFKSLHIPIWKVSFFSNKYLFGALSVSILLLILAVTWAPLQKLLSLTSLTVNEMAVLFGIGLFNLLLIETTKYIVFERNER